MKRKIIYILITSVFIIILFILSVYCMYSYQRHNLKNFDIIDTNYDSQNNTLVFKIVVSKDSYKSDLLYIYKFASRYRLVRSRDVEVQFYSSSDKALSGSDYDVMRIASLGNSDIQTFSLPKTNYTCNCNN